LSGDLASFAYRMVLAYDGSEYHGWQAQAAVATVEGAFSDALSSVSGERPRVRAAGRTDAGVHAHGQVVAFSLSDGWDPRVLGDACNAHLPADIAVVGSGVAAAGFDPRRSAWRRTYRYLLNLSPVRIPVGRQYSWRVGPGLAIDPMRAACSLAVGTHDFGAFGSSPAAGGSTVRTVDLFEVSPRAGMVTIEVRGDAFLRGMLRNLVGSLVGIGTGRIRPPAFGALLAGGRLGGQPWQTAPVHGLHQWRVDYDRPGMAGAAA
jgi:tRNA pseudouridine38-40 synthase